MTLIYLDKNFLPAELKATLKMLESQDVKIVSVLPATSGYENYPFSLSFLLQCFCRCLGRADHPTLDSRDPCKLFRTLLVYFN